MRGAATRLPPTLAAALAAARDGDTIVLGAGRFAGGVTISKSVHLVGAGSTRTAIVGGGPVVTVAPSARHGVTLSDLALTGGTATGNGLTGFGGELYVEPTLHDRAGAVVTLTRVWVHGNRATATRTTPSPAGHLCPHGPCPFAFGAGGGIFNAGRLTLVGSRVEDNVIDGRLSDADGGGIYSELGSLTLASSTVADNHARPQRIGRFAEGGGIFVSSGSALVTDTTVAGNSADLVTSWPILGRGALIDMNANSGGLHIGDGVQAAISRSRFVGNEVSAVDPVGEPYVIDSAMLVGLSAVTVDDSDFSGNSGYADVATDADVGFSGNAVEFDDAAVVTGSRITGNRAVSVSETGPVGVAGGLAVFDFVGDPQQVTVIDSTISGNSALADSATSSAAGTGAGVINNSLLDLIGDTISGNSVRTAGATATAQGGGIWNGVLLSGPPVRLRLTDCRITGNAVATPSGGESQGGGLYTSVRFTRTGTSIIDNRPDDVFRAPSDAALPASLRGGSGPRR